MKNIASIILIGLVLVIGIGGCAGISKYNGLIAAEEGLNASWGNVQVQYQRRADLIPNLVSTVQAAADYEQETLQAVMEARSKATSIQLSADDLSDPAKMAAFQQAQSQLSGSLSRLFAVSENYPQLRAIESFRDLQVQIEGTENRIAVARTRFNNEVAGFNVSVRQFPTVIIANMAGLSARPQFTADAKAEEAPSVNFSN